MTSQFPGALDNFTNPTPADNLNTPQVLHSDQHGNENDAIEAIEAWVGISGTNARASHEFRIKSLEGKPFPQELIGIMGWDEGQPLGTGTVLNIIGGNATLSLSGTVFNLDLSSQGGGGVPGLGFVGWNKGELVGTGSILNVTENDLTLSRSGTVLEISRTTGTTLYLGVNGSRIFGYRTSGTWLILSNSPDPQEVIGVYGLSNGVPLGTGTWIDFGGNLTATLSGTVLQVDGIAPVYPQEIIGIYGRDEGVGLGTGTTLNVVGNNIALSLSGTTLTLVHADTPVTFPQELIGIYGKDEGQNVGTGTVLNVVGNNIALSLSGTTLTLAHTDTPVTFPQEVIGIYGTDEGVPVGTGTVLDVVGQNISLTLSGNVLQLSHTNPAIVFPQEVIGIAGQDEGVPLGTGSTLNVVGNNIALSLSGNVLQLTHTDTPVTFPQEVIGFYGENKGVPLGTGAILNVNGSRLVATISGTSVELSNSPDPVEIIGIFGQDEGINLGTGTIFNVTGDNISLSLSGTVLNLAHTNPTIAFPQELIGVMGWDDGVPKGTGTVIDFGNNLTATLSGTVLRVDAAAGGTFSGVDQIGMFGQDEGVPVGTGTIFNVTGERLVLSRSGTVLNLNISPEPTDNIGVAIQNEGNFLATGVTIDVMGAVTLSGSVVNLRVPKTVSFVTASAVAGGLVFTNLVANDSTYLGVVTDLTGYTQCKLGGVFGAASLAVASGTIIHIMWATGSSYANLTELALNKDTEQGRLRWIASTQAATDWFTINPGAAYKDVGLHVRITGGNGVADPNLLGLFAEFR